VIPLTFFVAVAGAFAIGSLPFGVIVGRVFYRTDIRESGSGNIGAANALRTFGRAGGAAVLLLDVLKGFVPTAFGLHAGVAVGIACATAATLGHCFSPWLHFRGGKGVATMLGAFIAFSWLAAILSFVVWLAVVRVTRYSSVGSIAGCASAPLTLWLTTRNADETSFVTLMAVFIVWRHRENIARLRAGREHTIGFRRSPAGPKSAPP
jgi:acyl phosphate:glycerol-3-phosphate acyltransferase